MEYSFYHICFFKSKYFNRSKYFVTCFVNRSEYSAKKTLIHFDSSDIQLLKEANMGHPGHRRCLYLLPLLAPLQRNAPKTILSPPLQVSLTDWSLRLVSRNSLWEGGYLLLLFISLVGGGGWARERWLRHMRGAELWLRHTQAYHFFVFLVVRRAFLIFLVQNPSVTAGSEPAT